MDYINSLLTKTFRRRIGKNVGTMIGIALSVSLMLGVQITITSFSTKALGFFTEAIGENDIIIQNFGFPIENYQEIIEKIDNSSIPYAAINWRVSQDVAVYNLEKGYLEKGVSFIGVELDEDQTFGRFYHPDSETEYSKEELEQIFADNTSVLVGKYLFDDMELKVNQTIKIRIGELQGLQFNYKTYDLKIAGFIADKEKGKESGGRVLWTSIDNIRSIIGVSNNSVTEINISLSPNHDEQPVSNDYAYEVEEQLKEILDVENTGLLVIAFRALVLDTADKIIKDVLIAFNLFGALIIFSGVLLLVNIQLIQVEDRMQQLGVLRAIGSKRKEIIRMFLMESAILGFIGSLLGLGGGYAMSIFLVWRIGITFFNTTVFLTPIVTGSAVLYSFIVGFTLAIGAGLLPAIRASRVDPIEVIRGIKKVKERRMGTGILVLGISLIVIGITTFATQLAVGDSFFSNQGWNTANEQWTFMGAVGGILLGLSVLTAYLVSRKVMGNAIGFSLITIAISMLLFALPQLKDVTDNNKILITCVVILALGTIILVGVNLKFVTNLVRTILYKTKIKKGVSLISAKYMTSKTMRSTLTFGIFTLVLTMNIFASIYQATFSYNTLESVEFLSGGASIYVELDTPIQNDSLVDVERDLPKIDPSIEYVKGINTTISLLQADPSAKLSIPSEIFAAQIQLIYNDTFKNGSEYVFDFMIEQSIGKLNEEYKPAASEEYQRRYSHKIWDLFYNRTRFNKDGEKDPNGLPTVISTNPILKPGDVFNITGLFKPPIEVIVLANVRQYPFSISSGFPILFVTPDLLPFLSYNFAIFPKYTNFLVKTSEDFRNGRNSEIANKIETFFNGNESILIKNNDFVAASAYNVWEEMLEQVDFQVRTFDFMQIFVSFGLVVGAIGMIIIAIRNVSERKREIGMMRAIGYKKSQIILSISLELFILAGLGLFMGLINSIVLGATFARLYDWYLIIPIGRVLLYTGVMIGIAFLASIIPGIRSSRITPAEALRYVG